MGFLKKITILVLIFTFLSPIASAPRSKRNTPVPGKKVKAKHGKPGQIVGSIGGHATGVIAENSGTSYMLANLGPGEWPNGLPPMKPPPQPGNVPPYPSLPSNYTTPPINTTTPGISTVPPADPANPGNSTVPPVNPGNSTAPPTDPANPGNSTIPPVNPGNSTVPPVNPGNSTVPPADPANPGNSTIPPVNPVPPAIVTRGLHDLPSSPTELTTGEICSEYGSAPPVEPKQPPTPHEPKKKKGKRVQ